MECIFNHQNFWVNLDPTRQIENIDLEHFNEDLTGEWEYVMIKKKEKHSFTFLNLFKLRKITYQY